MQWDDLHVRELMSTPVRTVDRRLALSEAARILCEERIGSVITEDEPDGILTDTDVVRAVKEGLDPEETTVVEAMTSPVVTIPADATVRDAARRMNDHGIKKLLVTDDGARVGILTTSDVVAHASPNLDDVIGMFADG